MAGPTKIEWTDCSWNPIRGCSRVSEGCRHCYAERQAIRLAGQGQPYEGLVRSTDHGPRWTGQVRLAEDVLEAPLRWRRPRRIFVNSMSDLFHENVPDEWIDEIFGVMAKAYWHTFQVLTKRPQRMVQYFTQGRGSESAHARIIRAAQRHAWPDWILPDVNRGGGESGWPLPNVWLGVSVEDQRAADERIPHLLRTPAAVRFVSCEPLLGPIRFERDWLRCPGGAEYGHGMSLTTVHAGGCCKRHPKIDWIIVGGESGPGARPMHPDWVRSIRDQCQAAGVPFFFKQWGEWAPVHEVRCNEPGIKGRLWHNFDPDTAVCRVGRKKAGALLDGREWRQWPDERRSG